MKQIFYHRVEALRSWMAQCGVAACIVPGADPHLSEYFADHWKCMEWLSGFTGECGTLVITAQKAFLWTDSRYFIAAEQELEGTPFGLMKMAIPGTPSIAEWIGSETAAGAVVGLDGRLFSASYIDQLRRQLQLSGQSLNLDFRPVDSLWSDRPKPPMGKIELYDACYSGEETPARIGRIVEALKPMGANSVLLTMLDEVAWTFNVRGTDVPCNPVITAFAFVSEQECRLFIDPNKMTKEAQEALLEEHIQVDSYDEAAHFLSQLGPEYLVVADPASTNAKLYEAIGANGAKVVPVPSPIAMMKAIKNEVEIAGYRAAMLKDGIALTRFYRWLEAHPGVTELDCVEQLKVFRREQPLYREESFDAIVAWNEHAALPHYATTEQSNVKFEGDGILLIDTGGQYLDGTTDITRTIAIGEMSDGMRRDYTLVLKGHIRLATAHFPEGTRGDQLDAFARRDLWLDHKTYRHGTSHGVGHYLNVHEGPESIRMEHNPVKLQPGMLFSNEPAIYLTGRYGIRHENCVLVVESPTAQDCPAASPCLDEYGKFFKLETMTLCFIDTRPVDVTLLTDEEHRWLNDYNQWVYQTLAPHLKDDDCAWLQNKTKAI